MQLLFKRINGATRPANLTFSAFVQITLRRQVGGEQRGLFEPQSSATCRPALLKVLTLGSMLAFIVLFKVHGGNGPLQGLLRSYVGASSPSVHAGCGSKLAGLGHQERRPILRARFSCRLSLMLSRRTVAVGVRTSLLLKLRLLRLERRRDDS